MPFHQDPYITQHVGRHIGNPINKSDCVIRSSYIQNVKYDLDITLPKGQEYFGFVKIRFQINEIPVVDLFLDYAGDEIFEYKVNGKKCHDVEIFKHGKIFIPDA